MNEDVYKGKFARRLTKKKVRLKSVYSQLHGKKIPGSRAKKPIMGAFASPGVDFLSYFIGDFKLGVGDHRGPHFLDVVLASVMGTDELRPRSVEGRKLQVKDYPHVRKVYVSDLKNATKEHNMMTKLKKFDKRADAIIADTSRSSSNSAIIKKFDDEFNKTLQEEEGRATPLLPQSKTLG